MPELPFPDPYATTGPFDLEAADKTVGDAVLNMVQLMLRAPGTKPSADEAKTTLEGIRQALMTSSRALTEITRMRKELTSLRDGHRPQPHADPTKPGALCAACSMHGSIVSWPCATWSAAERILTHGKA